MNAHKIIRELDSALERLSAEILALEAAEQKAADAKRLSDAKRKHLAFFGTDSDKQRASRY